MMVCYIMHLVKKNCQRGSFKLQSIEHPKLAQIKSSCFGVNECYHRRIILWAGVDSHEDQSKKLFFTISTSLYFFWGKIEVWHTR